MPEHCAVLSIGKSCKVAFRGGGALVYVHDVDLGMALGDAGCGVDVVSSEVAAECEDLGDRGVCEILVPEDEDFALRCEERELVFCGIAQRGELDSGDLGAGCRR